MKISDNIFLLIKSLSGAEKRHFTLSADRYLKESGKIYTRLFKAIEAQKEYDEALLKKAFEGSRFAKRFPVAKEYLHAAILRSLRNYHFEGSTEIRLKNVLINLEILFEKKLYGACRNAIRKAKKMAIKYDKVLDLLALLKWEDKIINAQGFTDSTRQDIERLYKQGNRALRTFNNTMKVRFISNQMFIKLYKEGEPRSAGDAKKYYHFSKQLQAAYKESLPYDAVIPLHNCLGVWYLIQNDYPNAVRVFEKLFHIIESHRHPIEDNYMQYIVTLRNLAYSSLRGHAYQHMPVYIRKLVKISSSAKKEKLRLEAMLLAHITEMDYLISIGQFKEVTIAGKVKFITENINEGDAPELELVYYYALAYMYFGIKAYHESLNWVNKIIRQHHPGLRTDLYNLTLILNLIIHYELKNYDLLEYAILSAYRFLYKRKKLYKIENIILLFLRNIVTRVVSQQQMKDDFIKLKAQIETVAHNPFEAKALEYFDFLSWLESKISGIAFAEIVRKKAMHHSDTKSGK